MTRAMDVVARAAGSLAAAGLPSPRPDAEQIAAHVLGVSRGRLATARFVDDEIARFQALVERRAAREPLQHLLGGAGFRHLEVEVGPGVFVPRPETEVVVQAVLDRLPALGVERPVVVDLCTGSGAIALSIAQEAPYAQMHAVEVDPMALAWTRRNVERLGLPVTVHGADAAVALPERDGMVDCVVSNPPYVAEHEIAAADPEVRDHDPRAALVAGGDGLDVIRVVERTAWRLLRPGGFVVVEHGDRQGESAPGVFAGRWRDVADHTDLAGRPRYLSAVRP